MSVYVDEIREYKYVSGRAKRYGIHWSHMMADTLDELNTMADLIGLSRKWLQDNHNPPHYDITPPKRRSGISMS